jgi:hypothetical protein
MVLRRSGVMPDQHDPRRENDLPADPSGIEEPHDVLAAEEFAMPTRAPGSFPNDPTGIREPHDILAAEEFAMPTPRASSGPSGTPALAGPRMPWLAIGAAFLAGLLVAAAFRRSGAWPPTGAAPRSWSAFARRAS